jgi:hypothetical protein
MNQHYYTNRNEFIERFRQEHGLTNNTNTRQHTIEGIETPIPRKITNKTSLNNSTVNININVNVNKSQQQLDGRWDYLHKLEKLKRMKLEEQRKLKEQVDFEKDLEKCTFSPKLNTNKSMGNLHRSKTQLNTQLPTQENINTQILSGNLLERQQLWAYKKNLKIENIKHHQLNVETKECVFQPKIVNYIYNII